MGAFDWERIRRVLVQDTRGGVSAETLALIAVAVMGLGGFVALGRGMGSAIADGGAAKHVAHAMVTSRQAGVEEVARMAEGAAHVMDASEARRLAQLGRQIFHAEAHGAPTTTLRDLQRILGAETMLSATDTLWEGLLGHAIGQRGPRKLPKGETMGEGDIVKITASEAFPGIQHESSLWSDAVPDRARTLIDSFAPRKRTYEERPRPMGLGAFYPDVPGGFRQRLRELTAVDQEGAPWFLHDHFTVKTVKEFAWMEDLRLEIEMDPALVETLERQGLRIAVADFSKWGKDFEGRSFAATSDTLLINADDFAHRNVADVADEVSVFVSEMGYEVKRTPPEPRVATRQPIVTGYDGHALQKLLHEAMRDNRDQATTLWSVAEGSGANAAWKFKRVPREAAGALAQFDPRYDLPAKDNLVEYLKAHGYHREARYIAMDGVNPRVDLIHFKDISTVVGAQQATEKVQFYDAIVEPKAARIYLNLDSSPAHWPRIIADFVAKLDR